MASINRMLIPLLALFLGMQNASQAELDRLQQEVQRLSSEVSRLPGCSSESRIQAASQRITDTATPFRVNLFTIVSTPQERCLPANIRITATFFDPMDGFVCSGTLSFLQSGLIQNTTIEFRPYESEAFMKWWDGPTLKQQILNCRDYQGNELRNPTEYASTLRIFATVFPDRGGLSTSEIQISLPRLPRQ